MTTVALFHSVLGVRPGVLDAADRLRQDGHEVLVPDLFEGRTFDDYEPAMAYAEGQLGHPELKARAADAVAGLADGFVSAGFSIGAILAVHVATQRQVSGVLTFAGAIPMSWLDAAWPAGVPAQTHSTLGDPWREPEHLEEAVRDVAAAGATLEVYDYPGSGHLFMDASTSVTALLHDAR
jgi:dienelactone hydrolase